MKSIRYSIIEYSMVYPAHHGGHWAPVSIMLGRKRRGLGKGFLVGFGGKRQKPESIFQTATRELREETGLNVPTSALVPRGLMHYKFTTEKEAIDHQMSIFTFDADAIRGQEPVDSNEVHRFGWYHKNSLPIDLMWPDNPYWLPWILNGGQYLNGFAIYGPRYKLRSVVISNVSVVHEVNMPNGNMRVEALQWGS